MSYIIDCPNCDESFEVNLKNNDNGETWLEEVKKKGKEEVHDDTVAMNPRNPETLTREDPFRTYVRDLLGLSWDTRDDKIFDEIKRLRDEVRSQSVDSLRG